MNNNPRLCSVFITGSDGKYYCTNVPASSSHDAARKAVEFFLDPSWKGPKPKAGTVLLVSPMGLNFEVKVRVSAEWIAGSPKRAD